MRGPPKEPKVPTLSDLNGDWDHLLLMREAGGFEDQYEYFAHVYVSTGEASVAYRMAFDDPECEDNKATALGNALVGTADVQMAIADLYHHIGSKLKITPEVLKARLWQVLSKQNMDAKTLPKVIETMDKILNPPKDRDKEGDTGPAVPQVNIYLTQKNEGQQGVQAISVQTTGGDASIVDVSDVELPTLELP